MGLLDMGLLWGPSRWHFIVSEVLLHVERVPRNAWRHARDRGTSLIRKRNLLGPDSRTIEGPVMVLRGGGGFF